MNRLTDPYAGVMRLAEENAKKEPSAAPIGRTGSLQGHSVSNPAATRPVDYTKRALRCSQYAEKTSDETWKALWNSFSEHYNAVAKGQSPLDPNLEKQATILQRLDAASVELAAESEKTSPDSNKIALLEETISLCNNALLCLQREKECTKEASGLVWQWDRASQLLKGKTESYPAFREASKKYKKACDLFAKAFTAADKYKDLVKAQTLSHEARQLMDEATAQAAQATADKATAQAPSEATMKAFQDKGSAGMES